MSVKKNFKHQKIEINNDYVYMVEKEQQNYLEFIKHGKKYTNQLKKIKSKTIDYAENFIEKMKGEKIYPSYFYDGNMFFGETDHPVTEKNINLVLREWEIMAFIEKENLDETTLDYQLFLYQELKTEYLKDELTNYYKFLIDLNKKIANNTFDYKDIVDLIKHKFYFHSQDIYENVKAYINRLEVSQHEKIFEEFKILNHLSFSVYIQNPFYLFFAKKNKENQKDILLNLLTCLKKFNQEYLIDENIYKQVFKYGWLKTTSVKDLEVLSILNTNEKNELCKELFSAGYLIIDKNINTYIKNDDCFKLDDFTYKKIENLLTYNEVYNENKDTNFLSVLLKNKFSTEFRKDDTNSYMIKNQKIEKLISLIKENIEKGNCYLINHNSNLKGRLLFSEDNQVNNNIIKINEQNLSQYVVELFDIIFFKKELYFDKKLFEKFQIQYKENISENKENQFMFSEILVNIPDMSLTFITKINLDISINRILDVNDTFENVDKNELTLLYSAMKIDLFKQLPENRRTLIAINILKSEKLEEKEKENVLLGMLECSDNLNWFSNECNKLFNKYITLEHKSSYLNSNLSAKKREILEKIKDDNYQMQIRIVTEFIDLIEKTKYIYIALKYSLEIEFIGENNDFINMNYVKDKGVVIWKTNIQDRKISEKIINEIKNFLLEYGKNIWESQDTSDNIEEKISDFISQAYRKVNLKYLLSDNSKSNKIIKERKKI